MEWLLMFCSTLSICIFASLPCAECLKTWPTWTVLPQSVSSCTVSTSASIYPYVGKGRNARGDQSELLVEPIAKEHHVGIVHIWLSDYKEMSITYVLSFGNLKFTHIWTKYTCALWFWSSLKNNLKVQNNNFLRNNHRCCFWFCSNNFPFGSLKLLSDFLKNTWLLIFSTDIWIQWATLPFYPSRYWCLLWVIPAKFTQFFSCVCGREKMSATTTVLRPGGWGETAYQVFLRCEMFSGKIWNSTFTNGLGRVESLWQIVTAWQRREIPVDLREPPSLPKVWGCFPSCLVKR